MSRVVPRIVRVNVVLGDLAPIMALFFFDALSAMCWFLPEQRTIDSAAGLVVVPIMLVTLGPLMIWHVRRRLAAVRLLRSGVVAYASLREDTVIRRGKTEGQAIHRLHFTFEHRGRTYDAFVQGNYLARLVDDSREQIVFEPGQEPHAVFIDALPGQPRIREDNTIAAGSRHVLGGVTAVVLLAAAVAVNVAGAFLWLR